MKLATLKTQTRDGALIVVDRTLQRAVLAKEIAPHLQHALDHWAKLSPRLEALYQKLNAGEVIEDMAFVAADCTAPLPRAYQWIDGSAYVNHVELVRKARGAELPKSFWHEPLVYQGGSDSFLGPRDDILAVSEEHGIDFEAEIAIITDAVPLGASIDDAAAHIKLLMLANDVSLRNLIAAELAKGFGFFQSKPSSAFSPVAVTPDELGDAWRDGTLHLPLNVGLNGQAFGSPLCGLDMTFNFHQLIEHCAKTRELSAGTIIGSGTISNYDRSRGSACLAERRMLETLEHGAASTPFLKHGDEVTIEMFGDDGCSIFGAIKQRIVVQT